MSEGLESSVVDNNHNHGHESGDIEPENLTSGEDKEQMLRGVEIAEDDKNDDEVQHVSTTTDLTGAEENVANSHEDQNDNHGDKSGMLQTENHGESSLGQSGKDNQPLQAAADEGESADRDGDEDGILDNDNLNNNDDDEEDEDEEEDEDGEPWESIEEEILRTAVTAYKAQEWDLVARFLPNRTAEQCEQHWNKMFAAPVAMKGSWTPNDDRKLRQVVNMHGTRNWSTVIASYFPNRTGKQCRERWRNHLDPDLKRGPWTDKEERTLLDGRQKHGNKWSVIAKSLPGRSDNDVKNHWYASQRRLKTRMQIVNIVYSRQNDILDSEEPTSSIPSGKRARNKNSAGNVQEHYTHESTLGLSEGEEAHGDRVTQRRRLNTKENESNASEQASADSTTIPYNNEGGQEQDDLSAQESPNGSPHSIWKPEEGAKLLELVTRYGTNDWEVVSKQMPYPRLPQECSNHWHTILNPNIIKGRGSWTAGEDKKLRELVEKHGPTKWSTHIAPHLPGRAGKQCRERWMNALQPNLKRGEWTAEEEDIFNREHSKHHNQWALIASFIPGRTANDVKNHYYAYKRRQSRQAKKAAKGAQRQDGTAESADVSMPPQQEEQDSSMLLLGPMPPSTSQN